ncbi:MAG: pyruvate, water dikinase regulatory protein [Pseudomonadota bacterium]|uniref:pyruvate, water dikinase regulatory protein n=1 Tax=Fodinicurvata fenggangensis TaxID=1121830 RepID=UPI00047C19AD|nr:pyruvate, water dikinase regulatory protein [Fodinicurvata fenggangensis]
MTLHHHLHLVSDSTGETVNSVARACVAQFEGIEPQEHIWTLVRTRGHVEKIVQHIRHEPGPVVYTMVDEGLRRLLEENCRAIGVPCVAVLDPVIRALGLHYERTSVGRPGKQHTLDSEYFDRIEAMNFALAHDDGQLNEDLKTADVVLVGVSRTSKTPTCVYLAQRGVRAANVPYVPGVPLPDALFQLQGTLIIGLTKDPARLVDIRKSRLRVMNDREEAGKYADIEAVTEEVKEARRLYARHHWPVIDVTRRSIEETAAAILTLYQRHRAKAAE